MSATLLADVTNQIQKFWAPSFMEDFRKDNLLAQFVNKDYQGEIKVGGDTVRVSQIVSITGQNKTVGTDADTFEPEKLVTQYVDIKADKRAVASVEIEDLVGLQSQIANGDMRVRDELLVALGNKLNDYLYSLISPSTSSPDHLLASTAAMTADIFADQRVLAGQARWKKDGSWTALFDSKYWGDMMKEDDLKSGDFVKDAPTVAGQSNRRLYGFNCFEDNSQSWATPGYGLFFQKDFMHLVMQQGIRFKLSDLHANKQFAYVLSADFVYGAKLGIDGDLKHTVVKAAA